MGGASREAMGREFSAIGAFSAAISFVAAVGLCTELAQTKALSVWQPTGLVLGTLELAWFGVAALICLKRASLGGWIVGLGALAAVRMVLSATCAMTLVKLHLDPAFPHAWQQVSACEPRLAAAAFSLMICYPLRALLPAGRAGEARSDAEGGAELAAQGDAALWIVRGDERVQVLLSGAAGEQGPGVKGQGKALAGVVTIASPDRISGSITLPLRAVLPRIPQDDLSPRAAEYAPDHPVSIPLSLILPQLKEAQVFVRLEEMRGLLPSGLLIASAYGGLEGEPLLVSLALEDVVPALPAEVLELPPPSPPAWAELPDPESVVFATV